MAISKRDRAMQFMAFDALKGLKEAYSEKEQEIEERKELSDEILSEIQESLNNLEINDNVIVRSYQKNKYVNLQGKLKKIDLIKKIIIIDETKIKFKDITSIRSLYWT